ncbi:MAG: right-handed parallel beta-helix repeat-containing protein [Candidatus Heimdallarchaeota archaeon]
MYWCYNYNCINFKYIFFLVLCDEDFQSGFPGSGTKEDPYIIEFYNIRRNQGGVAISISNTTKHFIIRNCILLESSYGIKLDNVANGTAVIIDNICTTNYGIFIDNADGTIIDNNFCSLEEGYGIYVSSCSNVEINNNIVENRFQGIHITYSSFIQVVNNTCNYNTVSGIRAFYSSVITLIRNRCSFCENTGILVNLFDTNVTLIENVCNNNIEGINLRAHNSIVVNNTCLENEHGMILDSYNFNITNNNCSNNNYGMSLMGSNGYLFGNDFAYNSDIGLKINFLSYTIIRNNTFQNCGLYFQLHFEFVQLSTMIIENNWVNNKKLGFYYNKSNLIFDKFEFGQLLLVNCLDSQITNQSFSQVSFGLAINNCNNITVTNVSCSNIEYVGLICHNSTNLHIINNTLTNNDAGISLGDCSFTIIRNNTCIGNYYGIGITGCTNITVINNTINENSRGVDLSDSENCTFAYNLFKDNNYYAIDDDSSVGMNYIFYNNFIDNYPGGSSQARDYQTANLWYNSATNEGNYWSDWIGSGPYYIDGNANAFDPYPLSDPI